MAGRWITVPGVLVEGHRVASGPSQDYPYSSLERQIPLFKERGLDLSACFRGTLNISIAPMHWKVIKPQFTFRGVHWTDLHPPEDFSFCPCRVRTGGKSYPGWIYHPHPETKIRNFQDPSMVEVITTCIPGISYGSKLLLEVRKDTVQVFSPGAMNAQP